MKSFKEYLIEKRQKGASSINVPGTYGDETGNYDVTKIIQKGVGMGGRVQKQRISSLVAKNRELSTSEGEFGANIDNPNPEFLKRSEKSDTSHPILISPQGWIVDGSHRLAKLHRSGAKYANVRTVGQKILKRAKK